MGSDSGKTVLVVLIVSALLFIAALSTVFMSESVRSIVSFPCKIDGPLPLIPDVSLQLVVENLDQPVAITNAKDFSNRIFVTEQAGIIRIIKDGKLLSLPLLDISDRVQSGGETGLLSVAFHPLFKQNGRFFVNYTSPEGGLHTVISEFHVNENRDQANERSEKVILTIKQPFSNHNGGQIAFGKDGFLYIGMGDGGAGDDPYGNGQNLSALLGSILRIDVEREESNKKYKIPDDNPFIAHRKARPEIWAYGLRNPWRFSFDPLLGTLYVADVGQNDREEIDIVHPGKNYGWNIMEASICTPGVNPDCDKKGLTLPIAEYGRGEGTAVIGGYVYRGSKIPDLCGTYLYGDFGNGRIWALRYHDNKVAGKRLLLDTGLMISSFGTDEDYEVYVVDYSGSVYKIKKKPQLNNGNH